jgi:hypothetical protein
MNASSLFRKSHKKANFRRPGVEELESRLVPANLVVNSLLDGAPVADGNLTLREAITAAVTNAPSGDAPAGQAGPDTITFAAKLLGGTINLDAAQGQLVLSGGGNLTIRGPSNQAGGVTISGQDAVRVLNVTGGVVVLTNLTITRGASGGGNSGGGLANSGTNTTLTNVAVTGNVGTVNGGGIFNTGTLALVNCEVSNNRTTTDDGGGIANRGTLTATNSRILGNSAASAGGGIDTRNAAAVTNLIGCTVAGNIGVFGGGFEVTTNGVLNINNSTISGNHALTQGGGGIQVFGGAQLRVTNSTIAHNTTDGGDGGGGISINATAGTVTIVHATIVGNSDTSNNAQGAGGISKGAGPTLNLFNSIVAQNFADAVGFDNIEAADITAGMGNFIDGDPRLGPLQHNGGPTFTIAALPGSPVIDSGSNAQANDAATGDPLTTDQRGLKRRLDGNSNGTATVDSGATEFAPPPPFIVAAPAGNRAPTVRVFVQGKRLYSFNAYPAGFQGGVRVAVGDVTGDGVPDIVTAPGSGITTQVKVFDGQTRQLSSSFLPYGANFKNGAFVAVVNIDGGAASEIIVGPSQGKKPVKVVTGQGALVGSLSFFPYGPSYQGGVKVAGGDVDGTSAAEIVTLRQTGPSQVRIFDNAAALIRQFNSASGAGSSVAVGNVDGLGKAEILIGTGPGRLATVKVFDGTTGAQVRSFVAYRGFQGGVHVAAFDRDGDTLDEILTGPGSGAAQRVKVFDGLTPALIDKFFAFEAGFAGGVFVGG